MVRWNNIISVSHDVGVGVGRWVDDNSRCKLGDSVSTLFWWDLWLDIGVVKDRLVVFLIFLIIIW